MCRNTCYTFKFVSFVKAVKRDDKSLTDDKCYKCFKYPLVHRLCSKTDPLYQLQLYQSQKIVAMRTNLWPDLIIDLINNDLNNVFSFFFFIFFLRNGNKFLYK